MLLGLFILTDNTVAKMSYPLPHDVKLFTHTYALYIDEDNSIDIDKFMALPDSSLSHSDRTNLGYFEHRIWISYDLKNPSQKKRDVKISFVAINQRQIRLYTATQNQQSDALFTQEVMESLNFRTPTFYLTFKPFEEKRLIFYIEPSNHSVHLKHFIISESSWLPYTTWDTMFHMSIIGGYFAIFFFNIFLYLSLKDKTYLFYLIYCFFAGIVLISSMGYIELAMGKPSYFNAMDYQIFMRSLASISAIVFSCCFLETKKLNPKFIYIYNILLTGNVLSFILGLFDVRAYELSTTVINLAGLTIIADGIICYRRGKKSALFFLVGWGVLIASIIVWTIHTYGFLDVSNYLLYVSISNLPNMGIVFEMIFMSLALGKRIKYLIEQSVLAEEKASEAETMRQLVRILSHDVNTPIAVIRGAAEICRSQRSIERIYSYLGKIEKATIKLELINQHVRKIIALRTSKSIIDVSPVDLKEIVEDTVSLFVDTLDQKEIKLEIDCQVQSDGKLLVLAEEVSLGNEVLNNLISNAIKFSKRGSNIKLLIEQHAGKVVVSIADRGMGIPQDIISVLFNPDAPTHRKGTENEEGTGFGMPIVKTYVDAYGGSIDVISDDDPESAERGTTFKVTLNSAS